MSVEFFERDSQEENIEEKIKLTKERKSGLAQFLIRKNIAKNENQGNMLIATVAIFFFSLSIVLFYISSWYNPN